MSSLSAPYLHCEEAAFAHLEKMLWPQGPVCPHCGSMGKHYDLRKTRLGLRKCFEKACRKQFTVKVGTVFESAHIPLNKVLQAVYLMIASKKGVSSHQIHRTLGITYKAAWFLTHRIREAMRDGALAPMGGAGGIVEVDKTFIGVEARVMTDEAGRYRKLGADFAGHGFTRHGQGEYVDLVDRSIHTNTIEGAFSIFKRDMKGVYQHCGKQHLHRYVAEFDFRYNNRVKLGCGDTERAERALKGIVGKRLTYRNSDWSLAS